MCGFVALIDHRLPAAEARGLVVRQGRRLQHRGPDWSGAWADGRFALAHERLSIVDVHGGAQPLRSADGGLILAVNGEIYDHERLRAGFPDWAWQSGSDCEVILPLFAARGAACVQALRGMYAFALVEPETGKWLVARDHMGIIPLYYGRLRGGGLAVASELKALVDLCDEILPFPPGATLTESDAAPVVWYHPSWQSYDAVPDVPASPDALREALADAVRSHLMCDVPYGVLLSGGLDSSVIAALAARLAEGRVESGGAERAWWPRLHTFAIGLEGSPDLAAAQVVADHLGTAHHGFTFTLEDGLDALRDVIWHLETFDVTTVRASTPMYLMARRIKAMGVKMVLSGEGSDELFGGYLYFHKAPNAREFHEENVRKLQTLHLYDCLRANKSMAAWGVEARVPFLDRPFMDVAMNIHASNKLIPKGGIEKRVLREAFQGWLPESILWRQKEQFSDGVGYGWIDHLKRHAEAVVSDVAFAAAAARFPIGTPGTKEAYLYRSIFEERYPHPQAAATVPGGPSVACSTPTAIAWDAAFAKNADPSGRAVIGVHRG